MHQISGQPSKTENHPDYIPSVFAYKEAPSSGVLERFNRNQERRKRQRGAVPLQDEVCKQARLDDVPPTADTNTPSNENACSSATTNTQSNPIESDYSLLLHDGEIERNRLKEKLQLVLRENSEIKEKHRADIAKLTTENATLKKKVEQLNFDVRNLTSELAAAKLGAEFIKGDDKATLFFYWIAIPHTFFKAL